MLGYGSGNGAVAQKEGIVWIPGGTFMMGSTETEYLQEQCSDKSSLSRPPSEARFVRRTGRDRICLIRYTGWKITTSFIVPTGRGLFFLITYTLNMCYSPNMPSPISAFCAVSLWSLIQKLFLFNDLVYLNPKK